MDILIQQVVSGLATGGIYGSVALALVMIYEATDIVNFAQGQMAVVSTYIAWSLLNAGAPYWAAFLATLAISFVGGLLLERIVIRPVEGAPVLTVVIVCIGLLVILNSVLGWIYSYIQKPFPSPFPDRPIRIGNVYFGAHDVGALAITVLVLVALYAFFRFTTLGLAMRAAQRPVRPRRRASRVIPSRALRLGLVVVLAGAMVLPFVVTNFRLFQCAQVFIYAIALLGLNILIGYNGQFSLGHSAFYALGAYTTAIMIDQWSVPYGWTIPVAGLLCLIAGFLFGIPALRLEGLYLALATFALALAVPQILKYFEHWTGGSQGIVLSKPGAPLGLKLSPDQWLYFVTLGVLILLFVLGANLLRGRTGRAIVAIRENPIAAQAVGVNSALYKSLTFGVSASHPGAP